MSSSKVLLHSPLSHLAASQRRPQTKLIWPPLHCAASCTASIPVTQELKRPPGTSIKLFSLLQRHCSCFCVSPMLTWFYNCIRGAYTETDGPSNFEYYRVEFSLSVWRQQLNSTDVRKLSDFTALLQWRSNVMKSPVNSLTTQLRQRFCNVPGPIRTCRIHSSLSKTHFDQIPFSLHYSNYIEILNSGRMWFNTLSSCFLHNLHRRANRPVEISQSRSVESTSDNSGKKRRQSSI